MADTGSKKEECKKLMRKLFGPATANLVDRMNEDECVLKCREKTRIFLGDEKARLFDKIAHHVS